MPTPCASLRTDCNTSIRVAVSPATGIRVAIFPEPSRSYPLHGGEAGKATLCLSVGKSFIPQKQINNDIDPLGKFRPFAVIYPRPWGYSKRPSHPDMAAIFFDKFFQFGFHSDADCTQT